MSLALITLSLLADTPAQAQAPSHYWKITYSQTGTWSSGARDHPTFGQATGQSTAWPVNPNYGGFSGGSSISIDNVVQGTVTATLTWIPSTGNIATDPPAEPVYIDESAIATDTPSWGGYGPAPIGQGTADDGLSDTSVANGSGRTSSGTHIITRDGTSGIIVLTDVLSAQTPTSTFTPYPPPGYGGGTWDWTAGGCTVTFSVALDTPNRAVTLHRDNARGETTDANGTTHGDTVYSYHDISYPLEGPQIDTDVINWQTFHPTFVGNWFMEANDPGSSPAWIPDLASWSWTPSESDDTWDTGLWSMIHGNMDYVSPAVSPSSWQGTADSPTQRTMTYTATATTLTGAANADGATASAQYVLTIHDPIEAGPDSGPKHVRENYQVFPGCLWAVAQHDGETVNVGVTQAATVQLTATVTAGFGAVWVMEALGINLQASYSMTVGSTVSYPVTIPNAGYGTYMQLYNVYNYYQGPEKQWDAGGFVQSDTYNVKVPDNPCAGVSYVWPPVYMSNGSGTPVNH